MKLTECYKVENKLRRKYNFLFVLENVSQTTSFHILGCAGEKFCLLKKLLF